MLEHDRAGQGQSRSGDTTNDDFDIRSFESMFGNLPRYDDISFSRSVQRSLKIPPFVFGDDDDDFDFEDDGEEFHSHRRAGLFPPFFDHITASRISRDDFILNTDNVDGDITNWLDGPRSQDVQNIKNESFNSVDLSFVPNHEANRAETFAPSIFFDNLNFDDDYDADDDDFDDIFDDDSYFYWLGNSRRPSSVRSRSTETENTFLSTMPVDQLHLSANILASVLGLNFGMGTDAINTHSDDSQSMRTNDRVLPQGMYDQSGSPNMNPKSSLELSQSSGKAILDVDKSKESIEENRANQSLAAGNVFEETPHVAQGTETDAAGGGPKSLSTNVVVQKTTSSESQIDSLALAVVSLLGLDLRATAGESGDDVIDLLKEIMSGNSYETDNAETTTISPFMTGNNSETHNPQLYNLTDDTAMDLNVSGDSSIDVLSDGTNTVPPPNQTLLPYLLEDWIH